jgi:hypothetical protein
LAWRSDLEAARRTWLIEPDASKPDALLMGTALRHAQSWLAKRAEDLTAPEREFISLSIEPEKSAQARARRVIALVCVLLVWTIVGLVGWINQSYIAEQWRWWTVTRPYRVSLRPYVLTAANERALKPGDSFKECASDCPEMTVVPAGFFTMGSTAAESGVDQQAVLGDDMGDDSVAVADRLTIVDDIGQLPARCGRCIENVLLPEHYPVKPQEREDL